VTLLRSKMYRKFRWKWLDEHLAEIKCLGQNIRSSAALAVEMESPTRACRPGIL
jgi:hypothetical protein